MLRIHCLQLWFDLSDPAAEAALVDSLAMRSFVAIDLGREPVPVETTVMRFRQLLEANNLGQKIFEEAGNLLIKRSLRLSKGTIVDATIITAPSSTKNAEGKPDPEMHQTRKGNQRYFGMKMHVGVDSQSKVIHSVAVTPSNTATMNLSKTDFRPGTAAEISFRTLSNMGCDAVIMNRDSLWQMVIPRYQTDQSAGERFCVALHDVQRVVAAERSCPVDIRIPLCGESRKMKPTEIVSIISLFFVILLAYTRVNACEVQGQSGHKF